MKIKNNVNSGFKGKLEDFNDLQPVGFKAPYHSEITKKSILERGFVQPFAMCEIDGELFICDGHLRKDLIYELINDGHQVPDEFSYYLIDVNNDRKKAIDILFSFNTKTNPIDLEVLTEWVNIEQVEVEVTSLNVVDMSEIEEDEEHEKTIEEITNMIACKLNDKETEIWISIKEKLGIKKDKNAIFALIKNYSHETDIN